MGPLVLSAVSVAFMLAATTLAVFVYRPASSRYGRGVGVDTAFIGGDIQTVKYLRDYRWVNLLSWLAAVFAAAASVWQIQQTG